MKKILKLQLFFPKHSLHKQAKGFRQFTFLDEIFIQGKKIARCLTLFTYFLRLKQSLR